jgi:hypothetical protein
MEQIDWNVRDLVSIPDAAQLLGKSFGSKDALYGRIRRGTLYAIRVQNRWYLPRIEINRLKRRKKAQRGELQRQKFVYPDRLEQELIASLTPSKRGRAALEAQALMRGTIRARLRRMYPDLSPREITIKYFQEAASDG